MRAQRTESLSSLSDWGSPKAVWGCSSDGCHAFSSPRGRYPRPIHNRTGGFTTADSGPSDSPDSSEAALQNHVAAALLRRPCSAPSLAYVSTNEHAGRGPFRRSSLVATATSSGEARGGGPRLVRPCHVRVPPRCRRTCAGSARAPAEPLIGR